MADAGQDAAMATHQDVAPRPCIALDHIPRRIHPLLREQNDAGVVASVRIGPDA
jgi:hypothetical protein